MAKPDATKGFWSNAAMANSLSFLVIVLLNAKTEAENVMVKPNTSFVRMASGQLNPRHVPIIPHVRNLMAMLNAPKVRFAKIPIFAVSMRMKPERPLLAVAMGSGTKK